MSRGGTSNGSSLHTRVRYDKLVPPDTFLSDYLAYLEQQETPYAYDFWTGCWLLSLAIGRRCYLDRPRAPVYLNLYAILVAESGNTRKSTSVRIASDFARSLCHDSDGLQLIQAKLTPENLEEKLHRQSVKLGHCGAAISISELVTFLGREKYVAQMPSLLTDLYDCPAFRGGGGSIANASTGGRAMEQVFVSFLSASTPTWLLRAVNPDVIEGGFTSRVVFIVETQPKRLQPWPEPEQDSDTSRRETIELRLQAVRDQARDAGRIDVSVAARKAFGQWYKSRPVPRDPFRNSFHSREDAHVLRLAAFLSANDGTWHVQQKHVLAAIKVLSQVREDGASVFEGTGSSSRLILGIDKVRDKLLAAGLAGCPRADLTKTVQQFSIRAEELTAILEIMHELAMVQRFEGVQVARGRPVTIWRATTALAQSRALDAIIEAHQPA